MNELDFARSFMGEFTVKGSEIVPTLCPYCKGGDHRDKYTFALNMENHTFNCRRGSCGKQGHFSRLLKDFGAAPEQEIYTPKVRRSYKRPEPPRIDAKGKAMEYVALRGIVDSTASVYGVGGNDKGEVVFPYYETAADREKNAPTFIKYRPAHKIKKGEAKARREKDTKPILFGMHLCKTGETLYIFEGEFDAMAGYQAHGGNCVSVPSGCSDFTWLETCHEWLQQFPRIAVIGDNDDPGREMIRKLCTKLDCVVAVPDFELYGDCKDANEVLFKLGKERLKEIMDSAKAVPVAGLINISEVKSVDPSTISRTLSGIKGLDAYTGGLYDGDLNVWTGKRGGGKSTILTQTSLDAVEQGRNVCVYSGEIPADRFKYGLYLQAATSFHLCEYTDRFTGITNYYLPKDRMEKVDQWLNGRYWLYDNRQTNADEADSVIKIFEQAYKRYDCTVFIVDNLMTVRTMTKDSDIWQAQANFAIKLKAFATKYNVRVDLVVHPRKTNGRSVADNDEVGGSGTLTNIACNVFAVQRNEGDNAEYSDYDSKITVLKNRAFGRLGEVKLVYHEKSRQSVERGQDERRYSWEKIGTSQEADDEPPF